MGRVTDPSKPWGQTSALGVPASVRAATRVKPEQASKAVMRAPSLLFIDEGRRGHSIHRHVRAVLLAGVVGAARTHAGIRNTGGLSDRQGHLTTAPLGNGSGRRR